MIRILAGCGLALLVMVGSASAATITGDFSGTVLSAGVPFDGGVGAAFSGSYSYDTAAPIVPLPGVFAGLGTGYTALSFEIDGNDLAPAVIGIADNYVGGYDILWVLSGGTGYPALQFVGPDTLWSGVSLANLDGLDLSDFTVTDFNIVSRGGDADGQVTAWSQSTAVPEPGVSALVGVGLAAMFNAMRRRSRRRQFRAR